MTDSSPNPFAPPAGTRERARGDLPPLDPAAEIPRDVDDALVSCRLWLAIAASISGAMGLVMLALAAFVLLVNKLSLTPDQISMCLSLVVSGSILAFGAYLALVARGPIARYVARRATIPLERIVAAHTTLVKFLAVTLGVLAGLKLLGLLFQFIAALRA